MTPTPNPTAEQILTDEWILQADRAKAMTGMDAIWFPDAEDTLAALRTHGLLSGGAPTEEQIERAQEQLAAEIHEAWEFQYDACDHGTYRGGHLNGEPYAMCELTAARIVRRRDAGVAPQEPRQNETKSGQDFDSLDPEKVAEVLNRHEPIFKDGLYAGRCICGFEHPSYSGWRLHRSGALCEAYKEGKLTK